MDGYGQINLFGREVGESEISPASGKVEYFILISPDDQIRQRVFGLRRKLAGMINLQDFNLRSAPHISLLKLQIAVNDDEVIARVAKALTVLHAFGISLKKAGYFKHGNTNDIILTLCDPRPVQQVFDCLRKEFEPRKSGKIVPHLTIGRRIPSQEFEKVGGLLHTFDYTGSFSCASVVVLRENVAAADGPAGHKYIKIAEIPFGQ